MRSDFLDSIGELYTEDDFRQLVVAIEATPAFFGSLGELEDHGEGCPFRKSYPDVLMVQPGQDWDGDNDTGPLDRPAQGRIVAQRHVRASS